MRSKRVVDKTREVDGNKGTESIDDPFQIGDRCCHNSQDEVQPIDQLNQQLADKGKESFNWKTVPQGAATSVWAASVALAEEIGGSYREDCHVGKIVADNVTISAISEGVRGYAIDPAAAETLWRKCEGSGWRAVCVIRFRAAGANRGSRFLRFHEYCWTYVFGTGSQLRRTRICAASNAPSWPHVAELAVDSRRARVLAFILEMSIR
jgi:hypothetical protein